MSSLGWVDCVYKVGALYDSSLGRLGWTCRRDVLTSIIRGRQGSTMEPPLNNVLLSFDSVEVKVSM